MTTPKVWRNKKNYKLDGKICENCNKIFFPARNICNECGNSELKDRRLKGKGKIETFTVIRTETTDNENIKIPAYSPPYVMAIVKLEDGPRLTSQIVDCDIEKVEIGSEVELVFRKIYEQGKKGVIQYGYKFRPA